MRNGAAVPEIGAFVRYFPNGESESGHLAFVEGVFGETLLGICLIHTRQSEPVPREKCSPVLSREIRGGLVGIMARHRTFGLGEIVDEEYVDRILYVSLKGAEGHSPFVPVTEITPCCPSC